MLAEKFYRKKNIREYLAVQTTSLQAVDLECNNINSEIYENLKKEEEKANLKQMIARKKSQVTP